jgi:hypothetical protein
MGILYDEAQRGEDRFIGSPAARFSELVLLNLQPKLHLEKTA